MPGSIRFSPSLSMVYNPRPTKGREKTLPRVRFELWRWSKTRLTIRSVRNTIRKINLIFRILTIGKLGLLMRIVPIVMPRLLAPDYSGIAVFVGTEIFSKMESSTHGGRTTPKLGIDDAFGHDSCVRDGAPAPTLASLHSASGFWILLQVKRTFVLKMGGDTKLRHGVECS